MVAEYLDDGTFGLGEIDIFYLSLLANLQVSKLNSVMYFLVYLY